MPEIIFISGPLKGQRVSLDTSEFWFGRDSTCDIKVEGKNVSRMHARIVREKASYVLYNNSKNGTQINGQPVTCRLLRSDDRITIGESVFRFNNASEDLTDASQPVGTVTFVMTDIEESTALWDRHRSAMQKAQGRHDVLIEHNVIAHNGVVVRPRGEGDSRFAVFDRASDAVLAALAIQQAFLAERWPTPEPLRVRIGVHTGEADLRDGDYHGSDVNRCARLRGEAHGGQILLSQATMLLTREMLPGDIRLLDLGERSLRGLRYPERIFELKLPAE